MYRHRFYRYRHNLPLRIPDYATGTDTVFTGQTIGVVRNSQWEVMSEVWKQSFQPPEARGSESGTHNDGLSIQITYFYAYFGHNSYFKVVNSSIKSI